MPDIPKLVRTASRHARGLLLILFTQAQHRTVLAGASVADQYEHVEGLPRILRSEIEQQLGKRRVIPLMVMAPAAEHRHSA